MERVGVREFKTNATTLLASNETIVIERHGTPIGFFVPVAAVDRAASAEAMDRLSTVLAGIAERLGISEDEIADEIEADFTAHHKAR